LGDLFVILKTFSVICFVNFANKSIKAILFYYEF